MEGKILGLSEFNRIIVNNITLGFFVGLGCFLLRVLPRLAFEVIKQEPRLEKPAASRVRKSTLQLSEL